MSELAHQVYQDACIDPPRAIALLDDFDGDGVLEIAVGRPDDASLGAATGAVVVLNGASGREMLRIEGDSPHGAFGRAVVAVGDLDGDSLRDLAVGAPAWGVKGETGSVRLVSSRTGALLGTLTTDEPFDNRFGAALDFDASANRLIVGVQGGYSRHNSSDYGGIDVFEVSSRVRVLRVRFASEHCYCELRAAEWGLDIDGPYGLGRGVRAWHDVDGDGIDEFFAAGVDTLNGSRVYLFSGADGHILRLWDE
ncbi:MAG: integrin alpha [Planctomycetes bacterium]|nr:integrin alpha [Planctomycetota bacterium]